MSPGLCAAPSKNVTLYVTAFVAPPAKNFPCPRNAIRSERNSKNFTPFVVAPSIMTTREPLRNSVSAKYAAMIAGIRDASADGAGGKLSGRAWWAGKNDTLPLSIAAKRSRSAFPNQTENLVFTSIPVRYPIPSKSTFVVTLLYWT